MGNLVLGETGKAGEGSEAGGMRIDGRFKCCGITDAEDLKSRELRRGKAVLGCRKRVDLNLDRVRWKRNVLVLGDDEV